MPVCQVMTISAEVEEEDAEDLQLQQALAMSLKGHTGMQKNAVQKLLLTH